MAHVQRTVPCASIDDRIANVIKHVVCFDYVLAIINTDQFIKMSRVFHETMIGFVYYNRYLRTLFRSRLRHLSYLFRLRFCANCLNKPSLSDVKGTIRDRKAKRVHKTQPRFPPRAQQLL